MLMMRNTTCYLDNNRYVWESSAVLMIPLLNYSLTTNKLHEHETIGDYILIKYICYDRCGLAVFFRKSSIAIIHMRRRAAAITSSTQ